jgi:hypothetical protein
MLARKRARDKGHGYALGVSKGGAKALMHAGFKRFFSVAPSEKDGRPILFTTPSIGGVILDVQTAKSTVPSALEAQRMQTLMREHHGEDAPVVLWGMTLTELEDGTDRLGNWLRANGVKLIGRVRLELLQEALRELKRRISP